MRILPAVKMAAGLVMCTAITLAGRGCDAGGGAEAGGDPALPAAAPAEAPPPVATPSETTTSKGEAAMEPAPSRDAALAAYQGRNRLGEETSPYLLQHKNNPVHWYAWGPEAFEAARALDRPIFLSVGYSTCYWCHVMERECFENEQIAAIMNELFICIKVDREERPDVDDIYMMAVQALTGRGGWPMSVFIEPGSLKPFFGGTYFPPTDRPGRPGFPTVMRRMSETWRTDRDTVLQQAAQLGDAVSRELAAVREPSRVGSSQVERAISSQLSRYDKEDGGFGRAPKFPMPANLEFLMSAGWDLAPVRNAVTHTLDRMATGGMYDQVGGGFHRYSTDGEWLVPHFEKMLYDNGQLASVYARAYKLTEDPFYAEVLRETLDYVLREMTDEGGAFYTAQDAEVNHREGQNYLWTSEQVRAALEAAELADEVDLALQAYGLDAGPNFRDPHHPGDPMVNVVHLVDRPERVAAQMEIEPAAFDARLVRINEVLRAVRDDRDQPGTDDKVLAAWNGLMIAGLADGGRVLGEPRYIQAARKAADFILFNMRSADGGLLRSYRGGEARIDAFFEDYAFLIHGLLAIYRAERDGQVFQQARELLELADDRFADASQGGYFDTLAGQEDLFVRTKSTYDGAVPCGASVMINNLLDMYELNGNPDYVDQAAGVLESLSAVLAGNRGLSALTSMRALHRFVQEHPEKIDEPLVVKPGDTNVVQARVEPAVVSLSAGGTTTVNVSLRIARGYHINAHRPGPEFLVPFKLELVGGEGIEAAIDYPRGESYHGELAEGEMFVHHERVTVPVRLTRTGRITGRPRLMLTYQACTNTLCLVPATDTLPLKIEGE